MIKIYHNSRCSKSRAGLQYLQNKNTDIEIVEYLKQPLTVGELSEIVNKLGIKPIELIRKNEDYYKKELKGKELTDEEWIKIMAENPRLIERPIIVSGDKAVIGRPTEKIDEIV